MTLDSLRRCEWLTETRVQMAQWRMEAELAISMFRDENPDRVVESSEMGFEVERR